MMNKKLLFAILMPSLLMMGLGLETAVRYLDRPGDWHFIVSLVGIAVFMLFTYAVVRRFNKEKKVQECDATEAK
jgi:Kef-type K+ transport system membrane component KefB